MSTKINLYKYHCYLKSLKRVKLCRNNDDKSAFLEKLADECIRSKVALQSFEFMWNHIHFSLGIQWDSSSKPEPNWLVHTVKYFVWNVNRCYGYYYRQKYCEDGPLFSKNSDKFKEKKYPNDFTTMLAYIHNNATIRNEYAVFEDSPFSSYNFYIASFLRNEEFLNHPNIRSICTSRLGLKLFRAMNVREAMSQFGDARSMSTCLSNFLDKHQKLLELRDMKNKDNAAKNRYQELGIMPLLMDKSKLEICPSRGHIILRYIDNIVGEAYEADKADKADKAYETESVEEIFRKFANLFYWLKSNSRKQYCIGAQSLESSDEEVDIKEVFHLIRIEHETELREFICAVATKTSQRLISRTLGLSREYVKKCIAGVSS